MRLKFFSQLPALQWSLLLLTALAALTSGLLLLAMGNGLAGLAKEPENVPQNIVETIEVTADALTEAPPQAHLPEVDLAINGKIYTLEVARTPDQARKGLMYRQSLPQDHGMLFSFDPPRPVHFWMKNTRIPLDMIFMARNQIVYVLHDVPPCLSDPCPAYPSRVSVDRVVELPAGTARRDGITVGMSAALTPLAEPPVPTTNPSLPPDESRPLQPLTPPEEL